MQSFSNYFNNTLNESDNEELKRALTYIIVGVSLKVNSPAMKKSGNTVKFEDRIFAYTFTKKDNGDINIFMKNKIFSSATKLSIDIHKGTQEYDYVEKFFDVNESVPSESELARLLDKNKSRLRVKPNVIGFTEGHLNYSIKKYDNKIKVSVIDTANGMDASSFVDYKEGTKGYFSLLKYFEGK